MGAPARHKLLGGKVQLFKRGDVYYCSASVHGEQVRTSTKRRDIRQAEDVAHDWYLGLLGHSNRGELRDAVKANAGTKFRTAADHFMREFEVMTEGQRNEVYVKGHRRRITKYLKPFFGDLAVTQVTSAKIQEYRMWRFEETKKLRDKVPARNTIHQEIVCLRQILKSALRQDWIKSLPDMTEPYKKNGKISHRAWFSPEEYEILYLETRKRAEQPTRERWRWEYEQLHDFVLFMVNTGLRPDEAGRLEYRDVSVVLDEATKKTILEIEVRGKRGVGYCKSMPGAVHPFQRMIKRNKPKQTDKLFPNARHELLNSVLEAKELKFDREGQRRTAYSLRHTYICLRLMEGADIYQIAKNCRTSVEMIEKYYASHIKNRLDAAAINVRKPKRRGLSKVASAKTPKEAAEAIQELS